MVRSIDLSTGYNNSTNNVIPQGGFDDEWILTAVPNAMATPALPRPAFSINNAWGRVLPNSNWISGTATAAWGGLLVSTINNTSCVANNQGPIVLERKFCVCRRSEVNFDLQFYVDNYVRIDFIDGNNVTTTLYDQCWPGLNSMPGITANISSTNNSCCNTTSSFDAQIERVQIGLMAAAGEARLVLTVHEQGSTTTGINLSGTVTGRNLTQVSCCATQGIISGRKIEDTNCNGRVDPGETGLAGWNFDLISGGSTVASATSDALGYFSFGYQNMGNYTVTETAQPGWMPSAPAGGTTSVVLNANNGNQYVEFLNCESTGEYCCDGINLIANGNFESGDTGFSSNYNSKAAGQPVTPGEYSVINYNNASSVCGNWDVEDHTHCITGNNNQIMVVNGQTQQSSSANNVIWQTGSPIAVEQDSIYKFCAYVQHLEQCCFDVVPQIAVQYRNNGGGTWFNLVPAWQTINYTGTSPAPGTNPPCEWEEIGGTFIGTGGTVEIRILLNEVHNSDGNDLALDDISLQKQPKPNFYTSHTFTGSPMILTASQFQMNTGDDLLPSPECEYLWFVAEVNSFAPLNINLSTAMTGGSIISPNWGLTTTFPGYAGGTPNGNFRPNTQYVAILYIYDCDCYAPHWEAEGIWSTNRQALRTQKLELSPGDRAKIDQQIRSKLKDGKVDVGKQSKQPARLRGRAGKIRN